jgi:HD superfamily phosphodiesterase
MEHVLRQCLISVRIAERLGLDDDVATAAAA